LKMEHHRNTGHTVLKSTSLRTSALAIEPTLSITGM